MPRCDDPQCGCQPYPRKNRKVEITLRGDQDNKVCELHQPGASLNLTFDLVDNALALHETINDPTRRYTYWKFTVRMKHEHMRFENLVGLPDGSLLLSLRLTPEACSAEGNMMEVKEKISGFAPRPQSSRLDEKLYQCDWPTKRLEIFMPEEKIVGWKTVALIAKTFRRITSSQWSGLVWIKNTAPVAGLNWMDLEAEFMKKHKTKTCLKAEKGLQTPPPSSPSPSSADEIQSTKSKPQKKMTNRVEIKGKKCLRGRHRLKRVPPRDVR